MPDTQTERSHLSQTKHIVATWKTIVSKKLLRYLMVTFIGFQLVAESIWTAYQPFYESDGLSSKAIGAIFSFIAVFSVVSAHISGKLLNRFGVLQIMTYRTALVAATTLLLLQPVSWLRVIAVIPLALGFGISTTPLDAAVQYLVASKYHTTAVSIVSLLTTATYALGSIHLGLLLDTVDTTMTRQILFTESLVVITALFLLYRKEKTRDLILSS